MENTIRLYDLFDNDYSYKGITEDQATEAFDAFKTYVADTTRGKRKDRIMWCQMDRMGRDFGVCSRLYYHFDTKKVEYICGQEWHSEMARLRDVFD